MGRENEEGNREGSGRLEARAVERRADNDKDRSRRWRRRDVEEEGMKSEQKAPHISLHL